MMRQPTRRPDRRGAAAVELALLLPFLSLLGLGAVDFARVFHAYATITTCARNGAIYASDPTASANSPYANYAAAAVADGASLIPQLTAAGVSSTNGSDAYGGYVAVTVTYQLPMLTGLLGSSSQTLSRTVRMRVVPTSPN